MHSIPPIPSANRGCFPGQTITLLSEVSTRSHLHFTEVSIRCPNCTLYYCIIQHHRKPRCNTLTCRASHCSTLYDRFSRITRSSNGCIVYHMTHSQCSLASFTRHRISTQYFITGSVIKLEPLLFCCWRGREDPLASRHKVRSVHIDVCWPEYSSNHNA